MNLVIPCSIVLCTVLGGAGLLVSSTLSEGRIDAQSASAKTVTGAARSSRSEFAPGLALCHASVARINVAAAQTATSQAGFQAANLAFAESDPPLWHGLGTLTYKITTSSADAQAFFDQGLRLTYAFNHAEAQRAFRKAQRLDPDCAMCFWGEALVLGPNINQPMQRAAVAPALAAARKAQALAATASPREQALIAALSTRYSSDEEMDRKALDAAYAAAMAKVSAQFPQDNDIAVLYAEALMDVSPDNYWQPGGSEPNPQSVNIVPTLERVLASNPNHPGAIHYYIHVVESSDHPERAEPYADRLRGAMPAAGHVVHMPSHIYYRIGRYLDALAANKAAVAADEAYLVRSGAPRGVYRLGYYPHNIHFLMAAAAMAGDGPTALAAAEQLRGLIPDGAAQEIEVAEPVQAAPYFAHAQFSPPEAILALPDPGEASPYVKAVWRYARGLAFASRRDAPAAAAEANAIELIERTADFSRLDAANIPAHDILKLARAVIEGRVAQAQGNLETAAERFKEAAAIQDSFPYMEPPAWYYPVRQTLAVVLMQSGRLDQAEDQFRRAQKRAPNSGWIYYGLSKLYRMRGDADAARRAEAALGKTWIGDRSFLQLSRL